MSSKNKQLKLAITTSSYNLVRVALKNGANADEVYIDNQTALTYAIKNKLHSIVRLLVKFDADTNKGNMLGQRPLHLAIETSDVIATNILLSSKNTDKNLLDSRGRTPLITAVSNRDDRVTLLLLSKKVNMWTKSTHGDQYADEISRIYQNPDTARLIKDFRLFTKESTREDVYRDMIQNFRVKSILYIGNVFSKESYGFSSEVLKDILEIEDENKRFYYLDSSFKITTFEDSELQDALFFAAKRADYKSFKNITEQIKELEVQMLDKKQRSYLTYAVEMLDYDMASFLRKKGIETYYRDENDKLINSCHYLPAKKWSTRRKIKNLKNLLGC